MPPNRHSPHAWSTSHFCYVFWKSSDKFDYPLHAFVKLLSHSPIDHSPHRQFRVQLTDCKFRKSHPHGLSPFDMSASTSSSDAISPRFTSSTAVSIDCSSAPETW